jgi:putative peptide zinc metalloprotease protein
MPHTGQSATDTPRGTAERPPPALADGVELLGDMKGSGYREPPALVRRADGQVLQLTPLLYRVLQQIDGRRDASLIAQAVSEAEQRTIGAADIQTLTDKHLLPLGLLRLADGSQPQVKKADPLLRMRFRVAATDPAQTRRITRPFGVLFSPFVVIPVLLAFAAVCWWVLMVRGLAAATHEAFERPWLLLLVFAVTLLSAGFHEFGHAAAATRAGASPGAMGAGLYLVWPAFYTDVTDSYRLGRRGRLLTDLGGLYFNAIVAVAIVAIWWVSGFDALLLVVATQLIMMVRQLLPIVRFDGYHVLADTTGVPDLFQRIRPTLTGLLPWRWNDPESRVLKPWARAIITIWVLVTVPLLIFMLITLVLALPRLLGTAWTAASEQAAMIGRSAAGGDVVAAGAHVIGILAIAIPIAGIAYILVRLVRQVGRSAWTGTAGKPVKRAAAIVAALAVIAALAAAWWPDAERYRPVQPYEDGTLAAAVAPILPASSGSASGFTAGRQGDTVAVMAEGTQLPGPDEPALAVVLVPRDDPDAPSWVFPFNRPDAATGDDTQALAVATEDGSVVYDVAFALVWAGGDTVDTTNEAYAFASCTGCAAVAVSFQVVLIAGQTDVIVPQNLSGAVNYECIECVAYALASQLVVTLDGPLSEQSAAELEALWAEIAAYGDGLRDRPLSEIADVLNGYKARILEILGQSPASTSEPRDAATEPGATTEPSPGATPEPSPEPETGTEPGTETDPAPDSEPDATPQPTSPAQTPQPTPTVEATPAPAEG